MIAHVALEVRPGDLEACGRFWALLGFAPVTAPGTLGERSTWWQRADTQIHLLHAATPVVAPEGHVALVLGAAYAATLDALRAHGFEADPRTEHWGSPRCFVRCPAGHRVELMARAPSPLRDA